MKCPTCNQIVTWQKPKLTPTQKEIMDRLKRGEKLYWPAGQNPEMPSRIPAPSSRVIERLIDLDLLNAPHYQDKYEITIRT